MNTTFTPPRHSTSSCCLAPTPPTRKSSRPDLDKLSRVSSAPSKHLGSCDAPTPVTLQNAVFSRSVIAPGRRSISREKQISSTTLKAASSVILDTTSKQSTATAQSIGLVRTSSSCDRIPSKPMRMHSPVKASRQMRTIPPSWNEATSLSPLDFASQKEKSSAVIRKPDIKSNIFLQTLKSSTSISTSSKEARTNRNRPSKNKPRSLTHPTAHIEAIRLGRSPSSILEAAVLGASEVSDKDHLISRWDSSSSLSYPLRPHEALSPSLEFFLNKEEPRLSR
ncbi:hypothetical protein FisN_6Hu020 [Fistulifera solaris]|uniref:Uncharacterized protein n=1 Tax=Fistulifera solaris TaxID=1519565 RepID=A0A1Z5KI01_FISSO|nr:hypothetical protein FisN_6Hu020 [Fistulifera solaris]|eukprot:GAX25940.1 hypothetical protein FisN_6Hu020 [Fistulifera solaris]